MLQQTLASQVQEHREEWRIGLTKSWLAECNLGQGKIAEARRFLDEAIPAIEKEYGAGHHLARHARRLRSECEAPGRSQGAPGSRP